MEIPEAAEWIVSSRATSFGVITGYQGNYRYKILIVDDRWENRSVVKNLLEPIGFTLVEAVNGEDGIAKANSFQPDLIITDLAMPVMNGLEMVKQMRESPNLKQTIIIASSASVFDFHRQEARAAGCNDFIPKPVQAEELLDQLQYYLKLEWIYENTPKPEPPNTFVTNGDGWIVPETIHLQNLHTAVQRCRISEIQAAAQQLKQVDSQYSPFADKVLALASEFDIDAIALLLEQSAVKTDE
ncbi:response regulator [Calothrix sp. NIES-3974]|uniref:response regulator n=1 Tax=Calothrix sp. NIES-3974 TaxID=2005462 RepID=UPI000B61031A|nr:response regulator [Calothrix sp. NIES-3974]BAZ05089.1 sensor protein [Calothrix sp. NIES-3974]